MIGILIMIGQFIVALSILVAIHELGHMLPALWFGMKVEKYYIGFPPKIFSFVRKGIEFGLGAIPLGGFVKISGMIDESLDTKNLDAAPQPWEFRAKPAWQRLVVMLGGVTVNFVFGVIIVGIMLWTWGITKVPISAIKHGIHPMEAAQELGFKPGDEIVAINGKKVEFYNEIIVPKSIIDGDAIYTVKRGSEELHIGVPVETLNKLNEHPFILARTELYVGGVVEGTGAEKAGLKHGDKIFKINGSPVQFMDELKEVANKNKNKSISVGLQRGKDTINVNVLVSAEGTMGVNLENKDEYPTVTEKFSLGSAFLTAPSYAADLVTTHLKAFKLMFQGRINPAKTVGGPVKMAGQFGTTFTLEKFFTLLAVISIMLAFMNLLPIPALDGGHVMFLLFEVITRRKPSDKIVEVSQRVGMMLLLTLTVLITFKDIFEKF